MATEKRLDLISRRDLIKEVVDNAPQVDAVEVVHGRWEDKWGGKYANPHYVCSNCKKSALYKCDYQVIGTGLWMQDLTDYCPNCGAKKDGGSDDA